MNKTYLVYSGIGNDRDIVTVCATEELANQYIEEHNKYPDLSCTYNLHFEELKVITEKREILKRTPVISIIIDMTDEMVMDHCIDIVSESEPVTLTHKINRNYENPFLHVIIPITDEELDSFTESQVKEIAEKKYCEIKTIKLTYGLTFEELVEILNKTHSGDIEITE